MTQEEVWFDADDAAGREDEEERHGVTKTWDSTVAYLYLDGETFLQLNLTAPYWGAVSALETVPPIRPSPEGKGDLVDWSIFLLILAGTLFGFAVMIHQVGVVIDPRLRFRRVFHPTMDDSDWLSDDALNFEGGKLQQGGGFSHKELNMTVESIPTSMGGDQGSPPKLFCNSSDATAAVDNNNNGIDLEMAERHPSKLLDEVGRPPGSFRDPDSVERPSSKSMSKVSLPQMSPVEDCGVTSHLHFKENKNPPMPPLGK